VRDVNDSEFRSYVAQLDLGPMPIYLNQMTHNWFAMLSGCSQHKDMLAYPREKQFIPFAALVTPQLGLAVILNHVLASVCKRGLLPVASDRAFDHLLRMKLSQSLRSLPETMLARMGLKERGDYLAQVVLREELPDFDLKSFDDVLELRESLGDELEAFRTEMYRFAAQMSAAATLSDVQNEAEQILYESIRPALRDLRAKLSMSRNKFLHRVVKDVKSMKPTIPIIGSLFVGLPLWMGVALSAGVVALDAFLDTYFEMRETKEMNGLSFLLDFRE
jgi:hypothetical protein